MNRMEPSSTTKTRSGRLVKKPERYTPNEKVEDDYDTDDYDSDDPNGSEYSTDPEESEDDESDSEGSLKDFIVNSSEDEEESDCD
jgi:hypothetical protein